eukprot:Gregarina_sp_Poly_1__1476@NODE_136_length_13140_cov_67_629236_g121_i0_p3_GENE_NODE_136_length_13140_cov_67_629236_g121_i0NODE_136_length_13140_cov_67_629236_g121_i0_p3_ORF_typecomplete_len737_score125_74_NODE_136_length_13140_cov_67_629236_g121_i041696379
MARRDNPEHKSIALLEYCHNTLRIVSSAKNYFDVDFVNIEELKQILHSHLDLIEIAYVLKMATETEVTSRRFSFENMDEILRQKRTDLKSQITEGQQSIFERDPLLVDLVQQENAVIGKFLASNDNALPALEFSEKIDLDLTMRFPLVPASLDLSGWSPIGALFSSLKPTVFNTVPVNLKLASLLNDRFLAAYSTTPTVSLSIWVVALLRAFGASPAVFRWTKVPKDVVYLAPVDRRSSLFFAGCENGDLKIIDFANMLIRPPPRVCSQIVAQTSGDVSGGATEMQQSDIGKQAAMPSRDLETESSKRHLETLAQDLEPETARQYLETDTSGPPLNISRPKADFLDAESAKQADPEQPECVCELGAPTLSDLSSESLFCVDMGIVATSILRKRGADGTPDKDSWMFVVRRCGLMTLHNFEALSLQPSAVGAVLPPVLGVPRSCVVAYTHEWVAVLTWTSCLVLVSVPVLSVVKVWRPSRETAQVSAIVAVSPANLGVDNTSKPCVLVATDMCDAAGIAVSQISLLDLMDGAVLCVFLPVNSLGATQPLEDLHNFTETPIPLESAELEIDEQISALPGSVIYLPSPVTAEGYQSCVLSGNRLGELRLWSVADPLCTAIMSDQRAGVLWKEYRSTASMWLNQHRLEREKAFQAASGPEPYKDLPAATYEVLQTDQSIICREHSFSEKSEVTSERCEAILDILVLHPDLSQDVQVPCLVPAEKPLIAVSCCDGTVDLYV